MTTQVSNVPGQANPANISQFNWRQLAAFLLLPVAWWFILLYGITPLLLPAFSTPDGELNGFAVSSIATLGYLFEFLLALRIFRKEGYALRLRALKERIHWRWPRGWKAWGIVLLLFVVGFGLMLIVLLQFSLVITRLAQQNKQSAQRIALLSARVRELEQQISTPE